LLSFVVGSSSTGFHARVSVAVATRCRRSVSVCSLPRLVVLPLPARGQAEFAFAVATC